MNVTLYGLKNCDTCRKALKEIEGDGHNVTLIDVREDGMDPGLLAGLLAKHGDEVLLNKKSTTWRELSEDDKDQKSYTPIETSISHETAGTCNRSRCQFCWLVARNAC